MATASEDKLRLPPFNTVLTAVAPDSRIKVPPELTSAFIIVHPEGTLMDPPELIVQLFILPAEAC